MMEGGFVVLLWVVLLVFAVGFFIRAAAHFNAERRQKDEMISVLKDIRDVLKKS